MLSRKQIVDDINQKISSGGSNPSECPLTAIQATIIMHTLDQIHSEQADVKSTLALIQLAISEMRLENARQTGYKQGAGFWFKLGAGTMVVTLLGGVALVVAAMSGHIDLASLLKLGEVVK